MSEHTPGPWTLSEIPDNNDGEPEPVFRIDGDSTLFLIVAPCSDGYRPGENKANAHLISTAPELLEALESLLGWVGGPDPLLVPDEHLDAIQRAREAVAKAKGEIS